MQIVIDIPEEYYNILKTYGGMSVPEEAILNGTILPKGHGRLIDADAFLKEYCESYPYIYQAMSSAFKHAPKVDAVPVIRCKDCKLWMRNPYRESSVFGLCFKHKDIAIATDETDWCSWAERRTE